VSASGSPPTVPAEGSVDLREARAESTGAGTLPASLSSLEAPPGPQAGSTTAPPPKAPRPKRRHKKPLPPSEWSSWPDAELLALRFCDLDLTITGELEARIVQLQSELDARGLAFRPHFWLSNEWFTPDGVPGVAIPFYLAHPRLAKLELAQMLEVEGGTAAWCLKILRHEAGHAIENAYNLRRRRKRVETFGSTRVPYPEFYAPRPYSKSFVTHLDAWYAQAHPDEDFAETFAVWLDPASQWRERYGDWPALRKLEYMDELMTALRGVAPKVVRPEEIDPLSSLTATLKQHYEAKREHYGVDRPSFYDRDLRRLFSDAPEHAKQPTAVSFIVRHRREIRQRVVHWTNLYQYTIDRVLEDMIARCRELGLRLRSTPEQTRIDFAVLLTVQAMNYLHSGRHRVAL
jgi:hypothetical protein